jgi:hypothetical protein
MISKLTCVNANPNSTVKQMLMLMCKAVEASKYEVNVILLAIPSDTNLKGVCYRTAGYAESMYDLLTDGKGCVEQFRQLCHGGADLQRAKEIQGTVDTTVMKTADKLRADARDALLAAISMYPSM